MAIPVRGRRYNRLVPRPLPLLHEPTFRHTSSVESRPADCLFSTTLQSPVVHPTDSCVHNPTATLCDRCSQSPSRTSTLLSGCTGTFSPRGRTAECRVPLLDRSPQRSVAVAAATPACCPGILARSLAAHQVDSSPAPACSPNPRPCPVLVTSPESSLHAPTALRLPGPRRHSSLFAPAAIDPCTSERRLY